MLRNRLLAFVLLVMSTAASACGTAKPVPPAPPLSSMPPPAVKDSGIDSPGRITIVFPANGDIADRKQFQYFTKRTRKETPRILNSLSLNFDFGTESEFRNTYFRTTGTRIDKFLLSRVDNASLDIGYINGVEYTETLTKAQKLKGMRAKTDQSGMSSCVISVTVERAKSGGDEILVLTPVSKRTTIGHWIDADGVHEQALPDSTEAALQNILSHPSIPVRFEIDSRYQGNSLAMNFDRLLKSRDIRPYHSRKEYMVDYGYGNKTELRVEILPYRDGSKVVFSGWVDLSPDGSGRIDAKRQVADLKDAVRRIIED